MTPEHDLNLRIARKVFEGEPLTTGERLWLIHQLDVDLVALAEEES